MRSMRPALKTGLLPVWRDRDTVQVGIDPRRAVALTGMAGAGRLVTLLDGSRDREQLITASGLPPAVVDRVLSLLAAGGALDDFPAPAWPAPRPFRTRLGAELATASLARRDSDGGARTLARRQAALVTIHGDGRVATALAGLLAGAGLTLGGSNPDPGAAPPDRAAPRPDLVVIATDALAGVDLELPGRLARARIPHLPAQASEAIGVVGPLVLPGQTACLRCLDRARADADPAWPVIAAQLAVRPPSQAGCDVPLAAAVAAQAAFAILAFTDLAAAPAAVTNGTLELVLPGWQWRRRSWLPHPACDCGSHGQRG
jgi:bacteriocin biosynthesis cyclodehydratase domain-containing protein